MVDLLFKRYLWLIDLLRSRGKMTYEDISEAWEWSSLNDTVGSALPKRTLYNHCSAIRRQFGLQIECRRGRGLNYYYIANPEALEENTLTKWALEYFAVSSMLIDNNEMADKIILEDIPSARVYLEQVLNAMKVNHTITLSYKGFVGKGFADITVEPLCVKLFKRRWYMLCNVPVWGEKRMLCLDRITSMVVNEEAFNYPRDFDGEQFFAPYFGITSLVKDRACHIRLRAYGELPAYLRSLPLHFTQKEENVTDAYTDFVVKIVPTFEFVQEILSHREQLEVIEPTYFRDEIEGIVSKMNGLYHKDVLILPAPSNRSEYNQILSEDEYAELREQIWRCKYAYTNMGEVYDTDFLDQEDYYADFRRLIARKRPMWIVAEGMSSDCARGLENQRKILINPYIDEEIVKSMPQTPFDLEYTCGIFGGSKEHEASYEWFSTVFPNAVWMPGNIKMSEISEFVKSQIDVQS